MISFGLETSPCCHAFVHVALNCRQQGVQQQAAGSSKGLEAQQEQQLEPAMLLLLLLEVLPAMQTQLEMLLQEMMGTWMMNFLQTST
jgi:hypothetical protein